MSAAAEINRVQNLRDSLRTPPPFPRFFLSFSQLHATYLFTIQRWISLPHTSGIEIPGASKPNFNLDPPPSSPPIAISRLLALASVARRVGMHACGALWNLIWCADENVLSNKMSLVHKQWYDYCREHDHWRLV